MEGVIIRGRPDCHNKSVCFLAQFGFFHVLLYLSPVALACTQKEVERDGFQMHRCPRFGSNHIRSDSMLTPPMHGVSPFEYPTPIMHTRIIISQRTISSVPHYRRPSILFASHLYSPSHYSLHCPRSHCPPPPPFPMCSKPAPPP